MALVLGACATPTDGPERGQRLGGPPAEQQTDPPWPNYFRQPGGVTGLCTLALLHCGVEPDDKHVERALQYLRGLKTNTTYAVALQTINSGSR